MLPIYYYTSIFGRTLPRAQSGFFILLFTRLPAVSALIFAGRVAGRVAGWSCSAGLTVAGDWWLVTGDCGARRHVRAQVAGGQRRWPAQAGGSGTTGTQAGTQGGAPQGGWGL